MPSNFNRLRLNQLFNNRGEDGVPQGTIPIQPDENEYDVRERLKQLYNPQMQMQDQFNSQIGMMPTREQYAPGRMRQIGAALASLGTGGPVGMWGGNPVGYQSNIPAGMAVRDNILEQPYNRAMQDWKNKLVPLQQAADNERMGNINERTLANDVIGREQQDRTFNRLTRRDDQLAKQGDAKIKLDQERVDIQRKRQEALQFKNSHPTMKSFTDENGMIVFVDPIDPTKVVRTDINTGTMNDMEKLQFDLQGDLSRIAAQGRNAITTKSTVPGQAPLRVQPPRTTESTEEVYDDKGVLQGTRRRSSTSGANNNTNKSSPSITRADGKVKMVMKDGTSGWVAPNMVEQAIKDGLIKATK